jgi:hypothetical protein
MNSQTVKGEGGENSGYLDELMQRPCNETDTRHAERNKKEEVPSCQSKNSDGKTQIGSYNTARSML